MFRGGDAVLVVDPPRDEAPPFLPRVVPVIGVDGDDDIAAYAAAQRLPVQAIGVVTPDAAAVVLAERIGAVRVAPFGAMQAPPLGGHHGGAPRIADFVRWIDADDRPACERVVRRARSDRHGRAGAALARARRASSRRTKRPA